MRSLTKSWSISSKRHFLLYLCSLKKPIFYFIYPPLNKVKKLDNNILISYNIYKSFAARIELVLRESQEKINVEILQIGLAKIGLAKYYLILDSTLPFS